MRRFCWVVFVVLLVGCSLWGWLQIPSQSGPFPPTTPHVHRDDPLRADGRIDFREKINRELARGVTPQNNAAVLLVQMLGPRVLSEVASQPFCQALGIPDFASEKSGYVPEFAYLQEAYPELEGEKLWEVQQSFDQITTRPWTRDEYPIWVAWLARNAAAFSTTTDASRRQRYFHPLIPGSVGGDSPETFVETPLPLADEVRGLARALIARAYLAIGERNGREALDDLYTIRRLAQLASQSGSLIEWLVADSIDRRLLEVERQLLARGLLSSDQVAEYIAFLQTHWLVMDLDRRVDLFERSMLLDIVQSIDRYGWRIISDRAKGNGQHPPRGSWFGNLLAGMADWSAATVVVNDYYDQLVAVLRNESSDAERLGQLIDVVTTTHQSYDLLREQSSFRMLLAGPVSRGRWLGSQFMHLFAPDLCGVVRAEIRYKIRHDLSELAFAIEAYRLKHRVFPETLEQLVPAYLEAIPRDRANGEPLDYQTTARGYTLHAPGVTQLPDGPVLKNNAKPLGIELTLESGR